MENPYANEREYPRLEIDGTISAEIHSLGVVAEVGDVSLGGAQTMSAKRFDPGTRHCLKFVFGSGDPMFLLARVVYCLPNPSGSSFAIGWAWALDTTSTKNARALIGRLTSLAELSGGIRDAESPH